MGVDGRERVRVATDTDHDRIIYRALQMIAMFAQLPFFEQEVGILHPPFAVHLEIVLLCVQLSHFY